MVEQTTRRLEGVIPAPLTPLTEQGKVHFPMLEKQLAYLVESGADGLFLNGTSAEGAYLSRSEKLDVLKAARTVAAGRVFLCAACIQPSTPQVLEELEATVRLEPDFVVAVAPFYCTLSQEAIRGHFLAVARSSPLPLILYNIPQCTHNPLALETILELAREPNIAGVKDSSGDFVAFSRGLLAELPGRFSWIIGEDYLDGPAMAMGADGIVSGLANVWARFYVDLYRAARSGDRQGLASNHAAIHQLYGIHRVSGGQIVAALKAGAAFFGRCTRRMKMKELTLSEEQAQRVRRVLEEMQLL